MDDAASVLAPNAPPSGSVIAPPPPPVTPESGDPLSGMIAPEPTPDYTPPTTPAHQDPEMVAGAHHQNFLARVMDKVGSILGGDTTLHVTKHPDGTVTVDHDPSTEGEKWGRVAAAALGGAAHGISVGQGPGGPARAAAAGIQTGLQQPQQRLDEANKEASVEQLRMQAHANLVHTQQTSVAQSFANKMNNVAATQAQIDQANGEEERFKNAPGAEDMGTYGSMEEVAKSPNAKLIMQHHPGGTMRTVPVFDGDHNITGVRAYVVDKGWGDQLNDKPVTYLEAKAAETAGGAPTFEKKTILKGAHTNAQVDTILNAANTANLKVNADYAKAQETAAENKQKETDRALAASDRRTAQQQAHQDRQDALALRRELAGVGDGESSAGLVDAITSGHMTIDRLGYLAARNPALMAAVMQKDPTFDSSRAAAYPAVYKEFTSTKKGTAGAALNAGATALKHMQELKALNTSKSHIPGTNDYTAYMNKAETLSSELAQLYGTTTIPAIKGIHDSLTTTLPGNRDKAIETQAQSMGDKLDSFEQSWSNAAPSKAYEASMPQIDDKAKAARAALDPNYRARLVQEQGGGDKATPKAGGTKAIPTGKVPAFDPSGNVVGYADDKKGTNYHAF